ncbi:MAG: hypothetical protein HC848_07655 [Limnobacter sp.]|nr:hypothetical protein [Limnobacter sp.]
MNPWFFPVWDIIKTPFSGNVTQDISPVTTWLSPQFQFNFAGNRRVETEVVAEVASYGKQLGILSEAVLELADGKKGEAVARLEKLQQQIEKVKSQHEDRTEERIQEDLLRLKSRDLAAFNRIVDNLK